MAVSPHVISAYKRLYSRAELEAALKQALNDRAAGVVVTQINLQDGGGAGQMIQGDPNEIIETLEICLQQLDGASAGGGLGSVVNFSSRRSET
jgi:hypothetical protein